MPVDGVDDKIKNDWLLALCKEHVKQYVMRSEFVSLAEQTGQLDRCLREQFTCRFDGCNNMYTLHSRRVRYVQFSHVIKKENMQYLFCNFNF